ncbi:hypothetical protein F1C16_05140 [Hymenobacter sp. NBH84]|uniref:hypothetical protein n=1 Tax=Hymenobacter sp. NBH84 TaxID=2596915 RepID=UPI00162652CD|nr:hypothetical protein [Hymenobacter sp. NBH84]QNE38981.1 hypothetical protein F1C16_05140 [Hymenobacter sp. NBH84]
METVKEQYEVITEKDIESIHGNGFNVWLTYDLNVIEYSTTTNPDKVYTARFKNKSALIQELFGIALMEARREGREEIMILG